MNIRHKFHLRSHRETARRDAGYSLLELAVVMFMMSILATVAIVKFSTSQNGAVRSAAQRIVSDISYAQEIAKISNKGTEIRFIQSTTGPPSCFVATACYGADSPLTNSLRGLRDRVLLPCRAGRGFVAWYYRNGPAIAKFVKAAPILERGAQTLLLPLALLSIPLTRDAYAFGGGGGGGGAGTPNTYQIIYQDGSQITNPQGGGDYIVALGDRVVITSGNRTLKFDSVGRIFLDSYSWDSDQTYVKACQLNNEVNVYVARHTGKAWVQ